MYATHRFGLGVSYDSVVYVQASRSLSAIGLPQPRDLGGQPLYWWAPAYPELLRAVGGGYGAARWLNVVLLAAGTGLIGLVTWRCIDGRAAAIAGALYALSPAVMDVHLNLLAEPLFLVAEIAALGAISSKRPVAAGLAAGIASLARYAGIPLIVAGGLALRGRDRLRFLAPGAAVYGAWLIRNEIVAGQTTGRQLAWHPPGVDELRTGLSTLLHLVVTPGDVPSFPFAHQAVGDVIELAAAAALLVAAARLRPPRRPPSLVGVSLLFALVYVVFLLVTNSLFDALTPYDARLLVPIVPSLAITFAWILRTSVVAAAILVAAFGITTAQLTHTFANYGMDYSGSVWSNARFSGAALPKGRLYSTWPAAVAYFTGRSPRRLPNPTDEHTHRRNPGFRRQLARVEQDILHGRASMILLDERLLEIPGGGPPSTTFPAISRTCRPANRYVYVCTTRTGRAATQ